MKFGVILPSGLVRGRILLTDDQHSMTTAGAKKRDPPSKDISN